MIIVKDGALEGGLDEWPEPDVIRRLFEKHWMGSDDDLDMALEALIKDIQGSYALALDGEKISDGSTKVIQITVEDYISNAYF